MTRRGSTPASTVADIVRGHAEKFRAENHPVSAAPFYLRACHYYQMGERFRTPKDQRALDAYRTAVECFHQFVALSGTKIEIVDVPFEGKKLPGYFVPAQNAKSARTPCVVFFDGLDITKEIQFLRGVPDLVKRGISVLVMDGPGTGEAIRFRGMPLRHDYEKAGSACIDYLETRADVDAKRIGIVAISLGGYYAPRCASLEPRFAACIAWGAIWDYYGTWKKRIDAGFKASMSVPGHHIMWILGVDTLDAALKKLEPFRLDGVVQKMRCPFLVVHGEDDEQIPLKDAQALYDASRLHRQDAARVHGRGGRRAALPARLSLARHRHHVELVRGQAASDVGRAATAVDHVAAPSRCGLTASRIARRLVPLQRPAQNVARRLRAVDQADGAPLDLPAGGGAGELPAVGHHPVDVIAARTAVIGHLDRVAGFMRRQDLQVRRDDGPDRRPARCAVTR